MHPIRFGLALCAALTCVLPVPASAQAPASARHAQRIDISAHVREASRRYGIPEHWIHAVIRIESAGKTRAVSPAGAMGLMQLMPGTWARQRARYALGRDPFDPRDNILAGTSYLREMYDRFGTRGFLAAYNAGPGRTAQWLAGRRALPPETRRYVARITPLLQLERIVAASAAQPASVSRLTMPRQSGATPTAAGTGAPDTPANPFARSALPAHDLFVPVSTVGEP